MTALPDLLAAAERHAAEFAHGHLARPPALGVAIVTCIDARIDPDRIFGLTPGDANVIRNAGGRAAEAIRSLAISQALLGTREVVVVHHTDCGLQAFTGEHIRRRLAERLGPAAESEAAELDFLAFTDTEQTLRDDLAMLRSSKLLHPDTAIAGFVYDVATGRLNPVE